MVSPAIAFTVSRRGWRRSYRTLVTIPTTEKATLIRANRDRWRSVSAGVPPVAGAFGGSLPSLASRSLVCWMFLSISARVGASVPRPHAINPEPAALAHSARARCRRPAAQCPAPVAARVTAADTHSSVPDGLAPSRVSRRATSSGDGALLSSPAIPALSPLRHAYAKPASGRGG